MITEGRPQPGTGALDGFRPAPLLAVRDLTKVYRSRRRGRVTAVEEVSFDVQRGEILGLLGPNGAGKTTTIKCICTLITATSGSIEVAGVDAVANPRRAVEHIAAVLEGNRNIYWRLTVFENLEFFAALAGKSPRATRPLIDDLIDQFRLGDKRDSEGRTLSRGMQQKLSVACAFVKQPPLLLLDEPTLGLDVETSYELRERLKEMARAANQTILLSSHDMDVVQDVCERVIIIKEGRIVTDDRVANLLELFRARAYRFTLDGPLDGAACREIEAAFPARIESDTHHATIEVELFNGMRFYDLIDHLRKHGAVIDSVDRVDPDLEEIFLKIVKDGGTR